MIYGLLISRMLKEQRPPRSRVEYQIFAQDDNTETEPHEHAVGALMFYIYMLCIGAPEVSYQDGTTVFKQKGKRFILPLLGKPTATAEIFDQESC